MKREQHEATRELERAQAKWLEAYGWKREIGGRWRHAENPHAVTAGDAVSLTRAAPLVFGAAVRR